MTFLNATASPQGPRTFTSAIAVCLHRYFQFTDRAPRSEYWYFILFLGILTFASNVLDAIAFGSVHRIFGPIIALGFFIPNLAVLVRRLHDVDRTGWWALLGLIPVIGWIALLIWACAEGTRGRNRFGPDSLGGTDGGYGRGGMPGPAGDAAPPRPLLEIRDIAVHFGGIVALDGVSFAIERGEILGLIGPNGAGKTTLFNCVSRLYTPDRGDILFEGNSMLSRPPHRIAEIGIGRTFQNLALFAPQSVLDNIRIGAHAASSGDFVSDILGLPWVRQHEQAMTDTAWSLIDLLDLDEVAQRPAGGLPLGTRKRVELARALAGNPKLLMLDEPASGLNHEEVGELGALIRRVRDERHVTVLLVEHHMNLVMAVSDKVVALDFGRKIAEGTPAEVQRNPAVIEAYLGTGHDAVHGAIDQTIGEPAR